MKIFRNFLLSILDDLLIMAGEVLIVVGVYQVLPVATWFVAGAALIVDGVLVGKWLAASRGEPKHDH